MAGIPFTLDEITHALIVSQTLRRDSSSFSDKVIPNIAGGFPRKIEQYLFRIKKRVGRPGQFRPARTEQIFHASMISEQPSLYFSYCDSK